MSHPERHERALTVSKRIYKALLIAYPKVFRNEYGLQMVQTFRYLCREELGRGGKARLIGLWVRTVLDLTTTALVERSSANDKEVRALRPW